MASDTASAPSPSPPPPRPSSDIDHSGIAALVSWDLADGTIDYLQAVRGGSSSSLCHPRFHICYDSASQSALFRLQLSVLLKPRRNKSKNTAQFFLFIPPENVATLSTSGEQETPEIVRNVVPAGTVCLRFALTKPPVVVGPPGLDQLVPKNEHSAGVLASMQDFSRQTNIVIFISLRALDQLRLQALCTAASGCGLASIDSHGPMTLYGGNGGRILEASTVAPFSESDVFEAAGPSAGDSPPSYTELGPGPPPSAATASPGSGSSAPRKRPRRSSSGADSNSSPPSYGVEKIANKHRDGQTTPETCIQVNVFEKRMEQTQEMERRIEQMEQRLTARLESRLDRFEHSIKEQMQEYKRSTTEMIEVRLDAHEEQTQGDLDQLRREVDNDVEEQLIGKRAELDEQFRDERFELQTGLEERFADLEENISERFKSARAVLDFDW